MRISPIVEALLFEFGKESAPPKGDSDFSVSSTVSILAHVYEAARNAVEFRAEHLIRRAAIQRILKRHIFLNGASRGDIAENLIVELLWARYVDSTQLNDEKVQKIQDILDRYLTLRDHAFQKAHVFRDVSWDTVLGIASCEIEEVIIPSDKRQAMTNFFYQAIRPSIHLRAKDEKQTNLLTYIAVEQGFAQSDEPVIYFHLISTIQPDWTEATADTVDDQTDEFIENTRRIGEALQDRVGEHLHKYIRRKRPPFLLLRDFLFTHSRDAKALIEKPEGFEEKLTEIANTRYAEVGTKIRRSVVRSIIYIFATKTVFAFALEVPVDMFLTQKVDYIPLAINIIFPPILLFIVTGFIRPPGQKNTKRLIARINKLIYNFDELADEKDTFTAHTRNRRPILTAIFSVFYLATFLISFGIISYILTKLHFNVASQIIFFFFVTLVSFFSYRIRLSAKEYEMVEHQGFLGPLIDLFFLPILRVGHILSGEIAKINIFIILFDFILEAPLKVIFEVIEEWIRFIRVKKDEIV